MPIVTPAIEPVSEDHRQAPEALGTVSVDVGAITSTISSVLSQAIKSAFAPENLASIISGQPQQKQQVVTQDASGVVDQAVDDDVIAITKNTVQSGTAGALLNTDPNDPRPQNLFTSISVPLTSRVSSKIKAKIWANEFISFGTLLSDSPQEVGKYSLSMAPSVGASSQPQLTLEPCHTSKQITTISQWVSAFTIFVSVYSEKVANEAVPLMKYCEVVRDLASKGGDWHWYDEQFRYLRQSSPDQYPWDQIHWELWLRASNPVRKSQTQPPTNKRFRSHWFPKGTCWAFVVENTLAGSAQLHTPKPAFPIIQKANETVLKHRALHSNPVTPIRVDRLEFLLEGYDIILKRFLVDGFRYCFRVNFVGGRVSYESPNLKSALERPDITRAKLRKECDAGRIVGSFSTPPFLNFRCSPLGLVPKKDPSDFRMIHHLSYPKGSSVNDFIPDYCSTVKYASVGDAIKLLKRLGHGCFMAKTDVK